MNKNDSKRTMNMLTRDDGSRERGYFFTVNGNDEDFPKMFFKVGFFFVSKTSS